MCDVAAMVVDSEYLNSACRRVTGKNLDPVKFRRYIEESVPGRMLLWTHWCMIDDPCAPVDVMKRRANFTRKLVANGFRVIHCMVKPNAMGAPEADNNACDFYAAESVRLAGKATNTVIVATGDGHMSCVTNNIHFQEGKRVEIVCEKRSKSKSLQAERFHYLERIVREYDITWNGGRTEAPSITCQRSLLTAG